MNGPAGMQTGSAPVRLGRGGRLQPAWHSPATNRHSAEHTRSRKTPSPHPSVVDEVSPGSHSPTRSPVQSVHVQSLRHRRSRPHDASTVPATHTPCSSKQSVGSPHRPSEPHCWLAMPQRPQVISRLSPGVGHAPRSASTGLGPASTGGGGGGVLVSGSAVPRSRSVGPTSAAVPVSFAPDGLVSSPQPPSISTARATTVAAERRRRVAITVVGADTGTSGRRVP